MEKTIEIPEGYEARIEGNKVIIEVKESEDERIRKALISILKSDFDKDTTIFGITVETIIAWLEKHATPQVRTGIEWVNTIDDACDKRYAEEYAHGEYCHDQSFRWGFQEGVEWLERQGSQNLANSEKTCKIEPKFKVGDWVIDKQDIVHQIANVIENVTSHTYGYDTVDGEYFNDYMEGVRFWTIKDAKDGDVLVSQHNQPFIYNGKFDACFVGAYCGLQHETLCFTSIASNTCRWTKHNNIHPATKEQRDLLFQKMKEAGYEWDADKKELRKIEQKPAWSEEDSPYYDDICEILINLLHSETADVNKDAVQRDLDWLKSLKCRVQSKQEWSEEDEKMFEFWNLYYEYKVGDMPNKDVVENLEKFRDWLKSIKDRVQPPQEWSEEDKKMFISLKTLLNDASCYSCTEGADKILSWLKSLKERYTWKPSDEQLEALEHSLGDYNIVIFEDRHKILTSLYQDLKKRKG